MIKNVYTPNDFLDKLSDSAMIQAAVDEAAKYGVTVEIPRYNRRTGKCIWELDESIKLHTGSSVILDNCHLRCQRTLFFVGVRIRVNLGGIIYGLRIDYPTVRYQQIYRQIP